MTLNINDRAEQPAASARMNDPEAIAAMMQSERIGVSMEDRSCSSRTRFWFGSTRRNIFGNAAIASTKPSTPEEAVEALNSKLAIDLVISDIRMPGEGQGFSRRPAFMA
jgi:CheY-like chemotaxis protein